MLTPLERRTAVSGSRWAAVESNASVVFTDSRLEIGTSERRCSEIASRAGVKTWDNDGKNRVVFERAYAFTEKTIEFHHNTDK